MVVLDTNILIDHLRRRGRGKSYLEQLEESNKKETFTTSMITVQELFQGKSTKDNDGKMRALAILAYLKVLPYTYDVVKLAGEIARDLSQPIEFPDAAIAATTIINNAQLLTLNKKDFSAIKDLELFSSS